MKTILTLSVLALLTAAVPAVEAAPDTCDKYGVCGGPFVSTDEGVCAGYANPYGGEAVCVRDDEVCVITAGEFWYNEECVPTVLA